MKKATRKTMSNKHNRLKKVLDGKGKPVRGLWLRGNNYYAQMTITRPDGTKHETKVPLKAANLTEAREAYRKLLVQRSEGAATYYGKCPRFDEYAQLYLKQQQGEKTEGTLVVERGHIRFWASQFGQVRLNHIGHAKRRYWWDAFK